MQKPDKKLADHLQWAQKYFNNTAYIGQICSLFSEHVFFQNLLKIPNATYPPLVPLSRHV